MNDPDTINAKLLEDFDATLIEVKANKGGQRYIGHEHIRMRVIEATSNQFDWHVSSVEYRDDGAVRQRQDGNVPPTMIVTGTLTIPGLGARSGTGVQAIEANAGEDTYKAAESDAFKRAAMAFGVGLRQLYMHDTTVTAPATSRPQARQHAPEQARKPLTNKQFDEEVRKAMETKDGPRFAELIEDAGDLIDRWIVLINICDSASALNWVTRRWEQTGIANELVDRTIARRGEAITAERAKAVF